MSEHIKDTQDLCADCQRGYHAPFERFRKVAAQPNGPVLLMRCEACGCLWQEHLHSVQHITSAQAKAAFPDFTAEV